MDTKSLTVMFYAFFHSYINYSIIAWGGVYQDYSSAKYSNKNLKNYTQKLFLRKHSVKYKPSIYFGVFTLEALMYHYEDLNEIYKKK